MQIQPDMLVEQVPHSTADYSFDNPIRSEPLVRRVRPTGDGSELHVTVVDGAVVVFGGIDGARYEICCGEYTFQVRVTSQSRHRGVV